MKKHPKLPDEPLLVSLLHWLTYGIWEISKAVMGIAIVLGGLAGLLYWWVFT